MTTPVEPPQAAKKRISGAWYALTALPWIVAICIWYVHLPRVISGFSNLGANTFTAQVGMGFTDKADLERVRLGTGQNTIYVEGTEVGDRTEPRSELSCVLLDPDGREVTLERDTSTSMSINSTHYVSQLSAHIGRPGTFLVSCSSDVSVRYSLGRSFPVMSILWLIFSLIGALPVMGIIGYIVSRIRNPGGPPKFPMPQQRVV